MNNAVSGNKNDESWSQLFVEAIIAYLLDDENSPNEIDDSEEAWLLKKLQGDGQIDIIEKVLLKEILLKSTTMPESLRAFIKSNS